MDFRQCEYNVPLEIGPSFEFSFDDFSWDIIEGQVPFTAFQAFWIKLGFPGRDITLSTKVCLHKSLELKEVSS